MGEWKTGSGWGILGAVRPEEFVGALREQPSLRRHSSGRTRGRGPVAQRLRTFPPMHVGCPCPRDSAPLARHRPRVRDRAAPRGRRVADARGRGSAGGAPVATTPIPPRTAALAVEVTRNTARIAQMATQVDAGGCTDHRARRPDRGVADPARRRPRRSRPGSKASCARERRSSTPHACAPQLDPRHPSHRRHRVGKAVRGVGHRLRREPRR